MRWVEAAAVVIACCCCNGGESAPSHANEQTSNDKEKRHGAKMLSFASCKAGEIRNSVALSASYCLKAL